MGFDTEGTEVLAIAACYNIEPNEKNDALFIATGITSSTAPCDIIIWAAKCEHGYKVDWKTLSLRCIDVELKAAGVRVGANARVNPPLVVGGSMSPLSLYPDLELSFGCVTYLAN